VLADHSKYNEKAHICRQCMATHLNLDVNTELPRQRWKLRLGHWLFDVLLDYMIGRPTSFLMRRIGEKLTAILLAVVLGGGLAALAFMVTIPVGSSHHIPIGLYTVAFMIALGAQLTLVHNRLKLWCPFCRRDEGDGEFAPEPDPDPADVVDPSLDLVTS
jgi:hypothetical protein